MKFDITFDPSHELKDAEESLKKKFVSTIRNQVDNFFEERQIHVGNGKLEKITGPGGLLINDWLEKKFDDPATIAKMETYFTENFDRILEGALQKALEHKAKKFAFNKVAETN